MPVSHESRVRVIASAHRASCSMMVPAVSSIAGSLSSMAAGFGVSTRASGFPADYGWPSGFAGVDDAAPCPVMRASRVAKVLFLPAGPAQALPDGLVGVVDVPHVPVDGHVAQQGLWSPCFRAVSMTVLDQGCSPVAACRARASARWVMRSSFWRTRSRAAVFLDALMGGMMPAVSRRAPRR